jgi:hypothetical protein
MRTWLWIALLASTPLPAFAGPSAGQRKPRTAEPLAPYDSKEQLTSVYPVASKLGQEEPGGYGPSQNRPHRLGNGETFGEEGKISVVADVKEPAIYYRKYSGLRLWIVNRSGERATLSAIDSCLYIVQEAQDEQGEWKPIEKTARGTGPRDCAVGHHRVFLDPQEYWSITAPRYSGSLKTKLRFRLDLGRVQDRLPTTGGPVIYSNEFNGSVNPALLQ